jgi:hypothetical protein
VVEQIGIALEALAHGSEIGLLGVPDGDHEGRPQEQVDLADRDDLDLVDVAGRAQHDELDVAVALHLGALVGVDRVLDRERVQLELGGDRVDLGLRRVEQPDPAEVVAIRGRAVAQRLEGLVERFRHGGALAVDVDRVVDHRHPSYLQRHAVETASVAACRVPLVRSPAQSGLFCDAQ